MKFGKVHGGRLGLGFFRWMDPLLPAVLFGIGMVLAADHNGQLGAPLSPRVNVVARRGEQQLMAYAFIILEKLAAASRDADAVLDEIVCLFKEKKNLQVVVLRGRQGNLIQCSRAV